MKYNFIKIFIIFFLISIIFSKYLLSGTEKKGTIFTINDVFIDITSTSTSKAKEIALLTAQEKGFNNLMKKMLLETEYQKIKDIEAERIQEFVEAIEIQNEKTAPERYIGNLTIIFNENKILNFFNKNNIKFTSVKSKPLLILPIYKFAGVTYLWEKKNIWRNIWIKNANYQGLIPIKSSEGKISFALAGLKID